MQKLLLSALLATGVACSPASGQELARQITSVEHGTVRISFATRPGVEICEQGVRMGEHHVMWRTRGWDDLEPRNCRVGSAEVEIRMQAGAVRELDLLLEPGDRTPGAVDLGEVPAGEAAGFFLDVARGEIQGRDEEEAVFQAVIADVEEIWRELLAMAKDQALDEDVRTASLFWVGQEAAEVVTEGIAQVALDEEEDQEVREAAVFALSQRPTAEGVPILMDVARTARNAETRQSAMFWLAQSEDERVYAFFEEVLLGRGGGG